MGIAERDGQPDKRRISIGWRRPDTLEDNVIYVQLRQRDGTFYAEAESNIPFAFRANSIYLKEFYIREKKADCERDARTNGRKFIQMLVQENDGELVYRLREDSDKVFNQMLDNLESL